MSRDAVKRKVAVNLPKRELFHVKSFIGEFYDIEVKTNGSVTHYVIIENNFTGEKEVYKFGSRESALYQSICWAKAYNIEII